MKKYLSLLKTCLLFSLFFFSTEKLLATSSVDVLKNYLASFNNPSLITKKDMSQLSNAEHHVRLEQCARDEFQIFELENNLIAPWRLSWKNQDAKAFGSLFSEKTLERNPNIFPVLNDADRKFNNISQFKWALGGKSKSIEQLINEYRSISEVELDVIDYVVTENNRDKALRFSETDAVIRFSISGFNKISERRSDRGQLHAHLVKENSLWKLADLRVTEGETLVSHRPPAFVEASQQARLDNLPIQLRTEAIRRGGYALAVADFNSDGIVDLLIGMREQVRLLAGTATGKFIDVTKGSGLEAMKFVKTAVFADFENRGVQDLILTLLKPENVSLYSGYTSVIALRGDGKGHFKNKDINFGSQKRRTLQPMPAAVGDFNNDSFLDLYIGYPGTRDFTAFESSPSNSTDIQGLYINNGTGGFKDFTDLYKIEDNQNPLKLFPHSSMAINFDQAGGIDILVADDRNNLSPIYLNNGQGQFKQVAKEVGIGNNGYGMSIAGGDYNNDGITDIAWTNVNFHAARRMSTACQRHFNAKTNYNEEGLRLFKGLGNGKFEETTLNSKLFAEAGQGAAGVTFVDYDNDGLMDIYLVNGLWSGSKNGQEISSVFIPMAQAFGYSMQHNLKYDNRMSFKNVLSDMNGKIDINSFSIQQANGQNPSLAGYQHNRLFRNNGDSTFTEIAFFEGIDSINDGYIVGTIMNKNQFPDLILRNGDPGVKSIKFPVVQYFRNNGINTHKSVILSFEGRTFNRDAIGTFAIANFGKYKQVQHLVANSGSMQSERVVAFGLGDNASIPSVEVHWPNGKIQILKDLAAGRHHIIETPPSEVSQK